jgi:protein-tyrosine phosphatase
MDNQNLKNVLRLTSNNEFQNKVKLFRSVDFTDNETEVPDPYYGTEKDFQYVFEVVDKTASALLQYLTR